MKKTYTGGCQCGAVRYEVSADIGEVISCNCLPLPQAWIATCGSFGI